MRPSAPRFSPAWLALAALVVGLLTAAEAGAQIGTPFNPLDIQTSPNAVLISIFLGQNTIDQMNAAGGVTLFAASSPSAAAVLARVPYFPPFVRDPNELEYRYGWGYFGVPPGTYYVTVILGVVTTPNIATADWTRVVVPGGCSTPPGIGLASRETFGNGPTDVRLRLASWGGCASSFIVDVGTSPGAANITSFEQPGGVLAASGVPAGNYYVRVRGRNALGIGAYSAVLPLSVPAPACPGPIEQEDLHPITATVVGNQVTLSWPPVPPPPSGPLTFHEIAVFAPSVPLEAWPRFLLPASSTSISATVPSGAYTIALVAGNACGSWHVGSRTFTVP